MAIELRGQFSLDVGKDINFTIDLGRIHESAIAHVLSKGLDPLLRDCHANVTLESVGGDKAKQREEALALVTKKVESLYSGAIRIRGESRASAPVDPVQAEAEREARVTIGVKAKKGGDAWYEAVAKALGLAWTEKTDAERDAIRKLAIKHRAEKPEMIEAARKVVEARKAVTTDDLGL